MSKRATAALFSIMATTGASKSDSIDEKKQFLSAFNDMKLASAAQSSRQTEGRWDRVANEDNIFQDQNAQRIAHREGFQVQVFRDRYTNESKLVYLGSNEAKDWINANIPGVVVPTVQHNILSPMAARVARQNYNISSCVGYSLGGANAAIGCSAVDLPTVTANSARLNFINATITNPNNITNYRIDKDVVSGVLGFNLSGRIVDVKSSGHYGQVRKNHDIDELVQAMKPKALEIERSALERPAEPSANRVVAGSLSEEQKKQLARLMPNTGTAQQPQITASRNIGLPDAEIRRRQEEERQRLAAIERQRAEAQRLEEERRRREEEQRRAAALAAAQAPPAPSMSGNTRWGMVRVTASGGGNAMTQASANDCELTLPANGWAHALVRNVMQSDGTQCSVFGGHEVNSDVVTGIQYQCRYPNAPPPDPNKVSWCVLSGQPRGCNLEATTTASVQRTSSRMTLQTASTQYIYNRCTPEGTPYPLEDSQPRGTPATSTAPPPAAPAARAPVDMSVCNQIGANRPAYCPNAGIPLNPQGPVDLGECNRIGAYRPAHCPQAGIRLN